MPIILAARPGSRDDEGVPSALPALTPGALLTAWTWQPLSLAAVLALAGWYAVGLRRLHRTGRRWPAGRTLTLVLALVLVVWTTCGFPQAYGRSLFWVWTAQYLALLLLLPVLVLAGGPLHLARTLTGGRGGVDRVLASRPVRWVGNPLVGPLLVPVLSAALFFGPVSGWAVGTPFVGWVLQLAVLLVGAVIALPLAGVDDGASSLAIGMALAIGSFELVLDAIPGIVLRLRRSLSASFWAHASPLPGALAPLHDQQRAGAILWGVAELLDLPFIVVLFVRWTRADARDAAAIDAVLEAERVARGPRPDDPDAEISDVPWWLTDPGMQERLRRHD
jgi:putative membrane protein